MKAWRVAILALFLGSSPANALSGSEFLSSSREFAAGYAWGALEYRVSVGTEDDRSRMDAVRKCFVRAGVDSNSFYLAVRTYLEGHLSALTEPAIGAVLRTSIEMCPTES